MQQKINIQTEDIKYAERILLPPGKTFDRERVAFIKDFQTIDLQAVPGSGKTTVLLAKLLILETKLPLFNNRGILVLSHTNTAVDEIKEKIGRHCPKLFSYPNFIGTIQSFVDQFLAIPFYTQQFKRKVIRIDNEIYNERIAKTLDSLWLYRYNCSNETCRHISHIKNANQVLFFKYRFGLDGKSNILVKYFNSSKLEITKPRGNTRANNYNDYDQNEKEAIYNWLFRLKSEILRQGILHFDDAYFLAECYINKVPTIKSVLQNRFEYIFIDEMQDLDIHQYNLLEKIFYDEGKSLSNYQRIGDKNQAIYSTDVGLDEIWVCRDNGRTKNINGSQRLSKNTAELVNCLALSRDGDFKVIGKNKECNLKPHLLVYTLENISGVIPKFSEIISNYLASGKINDNPKNKYKAIGWSRDKGDSSSKLGIKDFYQELIVDSPKQKIDYDNLDSYLLFFDRDKKTLEPIRKNILNALIKILRLEGIYYTKRELLVYLSQNKNEDYLVLSKNLYLWSIDIIKGKFGDVYVSIKKYIPEFLAIFNKSITISTSFINTSTNAFLLKEEPIKILNKENIHGFDIDIATVHSVKGETHTATLYLETYYQNGNDNYESERLSDQFKYKNFKKTQKYHKQSAKMAYVGFSRPTHLLCVAVCRSRFDSHLSDIDTKKWKIIEI